ncbi:hypothetical protein EYF80_013952 [Liparis tanakae]|uniref:Uncharacterized protein n=1 Tax=Liparis tanakae TaxID=230148 RepID=A0A4Z2IE47_9TELE|nr:hypothetical protein EYF80_013952 [Liparis tanakae]
MEDVDGAFNTEMMQLTGDFQSQEVILSEEQRNIDLISADFALAESVFFIGTFSSSSLLLDGVLPFDNERTAGGATSSCRSASELPSSRLCVFPSGPSGTSSEVLAQDGRGSDPAPLADSVGRAAGELLSAGVSNSKAFFSFHLQQRKSRCGAEQQVGKGKAEGEEEEEEVEEEEEEAVEETELELSRAFGRERHSTHLISLQPFEYHVCCISGDLFPERVLLVLTPLPPQLCPEALGQLKSPQGRVLERGRGQL